MINSNRIFTFALAAAILLGLCGSAGAQCAAIVADGNFDLQKSRAAQNPWTIEGRNVSVELNQKQSKSYPNNLLINDGQGYSGILQRVWLKKGENYTLRMFVKTSPKFAERSQTGFYGFKDMRRKTVTSKGFGMKPNYQELSLPFRPTVSQYYNLFVGFNGRQSDDWIRVDNIRIDGPPCDDTAGNRVKRRERVTVF